MSPPFLKKIKEHPLIQPYRPTLSRFRTRVSQYIHKIKTYPEYYKEQHNSKQWSKNYASKRYRAIENALKATKKSGGFFGGWAVDESALRAFSQLVMEKNQEAVIVEFGSGQSTRFWQQLHTSYALNVSTYEHDPFWAQQAKEQNPDISIYELPLWQLSAAVKTEMFKPAADAVNALLKGTRVGEDKVNDLFLENAFYKINLADYFEKKSIDGVVVDGPSGNGRSICFPLLRDYLKDNAIILIDDYNHYPFLEDMEKVYTFEVLHRSHKLGKAWCIVQITGTKKS
jgi:hypothetical protein